MRNLKQIILVSLAALGLVSCGPIATTPSEEGSQLLAINLKAPALEQLKKSYGEDCSQIGDTQKLMQVIAQKSAGPLNPNTICENLLGFMNQYSLEIIEDNADKKILTQKSRITLKEGDSINANIVEGTKYKVRMAIHSSEMKDGNIFKGEASITEANYRNISVTKVGDKEVRSISVSIKLLPDFAGIELGLDPKKEVETEKVKVVDLTLGFEFAGATKAEEAEKSEGSTASSTTSESIEVKGTSIILGRINGEFKTATLNGMVYNIDSIDDELVVQKETPTRSKLTFVKNSNNIVIIPCEDNVCFPPTTVPLKK